MIPSAPAFWAAFGALASHGQRGHSGGIGGTVTTLPAPRRPHGERGEMLTALSPWVARYDNVREEERCRKASGAHRQTRHAPVSRIFREAVAAPAPAAAAAAVADKGEGEGVGEGHRGNGNGNVNGDGYGKGKERLQSIREPEAQPSHQQDKESTMPNTTKRIGSCLCGAVRITAHNAQNRVGACHCSMCRTWGGGPLMAVDCGTEIEIEGSEHVAVFDSSKWAERGFCSTCGTNLFYRLKQNQQYMVPAGLLDGYEGAQFDHQLFIDQKPAYYAFANETENMTGAQVFEHFGPET